MTNPRGRLAPRAPLDCMAKSALLTATAAALALVWCAQPAGATLAPPVVLEGVADTLMEDRFDTGEHFMHTVLTTAGGDRYLVDGVSHGEVYMSQPVRWVIQPAAAGTLGSVDAPTSLRSTCVLDFSRVLGNLGETSRVGAGLGRCCVRLR